MNTENNNSMNAYTLEQIADIVWLSKHIPFKKREEHEDKEETEDFNDIDDIQGEFDELEDDELLSTTQEDVSLYPKEDKERKKSSIKADHIRTPRKLSLSNHREWERSFRKLRYKIDSNSRFVLDELKTVDSIAQTNIYHAILKGKRENYFNLTLIIDQSSSMEIWRELIDEFNRTIQRFGLFNSISFYYLDTKSPEAKLFSDKNKQTKISYKQLAFSNKRGLILILSDCVSPAWRSNHLFKLIEFWSQYSLTSIVQMFPKRMWRGTALDKGFHTSFSSHSFNQLNRNLRSKEDDEGLNIPIVAFEPISFRHWADVTLGKQGKWIDGIQLEEFEVVKKLPISKTKKLTAEQREKNYRIHASPLAKELAIYASFFPVNFQVIRMLQELKLPSSNQSYLAEFFLGGLVKKEETSEKVYYEFHAGVKEILQKKIGPRESFRIFTMMSNFVAKNMNSALDFQALIFNPNSISGLSLSENDIAFAKICVDVLRRRGGEYEEIFNIVEESIKVNENRNITNIPFQKLFPSNSDYSTIIKNLKFWSCISN